MEGRIGRWGGGFAVILLSGALYIFLDTARLKLLLSTPSALEIKHVKEQISEQVIDLVGSSCGTSTVWEQFPECRIQDVSSLSQLLDSKNAKYIQSKHPPRYDHLSCPLMKSRYNCALPPDATPKRRVATNFKLVWHRPEMDAYCDFRQIVEAIGGPTGIGKFLMDERKQEKPFQVFLHGNSFLRQQYEALVCGFRDQITDLRLYRGGPNYGKTDSSRGDVPLYEVHELGETIVGDDALRDGCHSGSNPLDKFFFPNVTVPSTLDGCNDDIAMVEFGSSIRFFYIFHPEYYTKEANLEIFKRLGMDSSVETVLFWNVGRPVRLNVINVTKTVSLKSYLGSFKRIQKDTIGKYFGARNPWLTHVPDVVSISDKQFA